MFPHLFAPSLFICLLPYTITRPSISRHLVTPGFGPLEKMLTASNGKNPLLAATYYFNPSGLLEDSSLADTIGENIPFNDRSSVNSKQGDRQINSRTRNGHHLKIHSANDLALNSDLNSFVDESDNNNQQNLNELNELGSGYCISADDRKGICYNSNECTNRGGIPMGSCGDANSTPGSPRGAVCCIFEVTCGDESSEPLVYIQNPDYPRATTKARSNMCRIKIGKTNKNPICQFKVNMVNFNIAPPLLGGGNCSNDVFVITGQNENNILPKICGYNDGQHYYFAVDESGVITFNFMLNYNQYYHERRFNIQLTQIPCSVDKLKAPPNCLQYLTGTYGSIKSFNYQSSASSSNSYARGRNNVNSDQSNSVVTGYPNDLDYSICFKKEPGFCSITYELANIEGGRLSPFEIGTSESFTGHRVVSSFTHTLANSLLSSRSSNRDVSKFNVLSNNHHNVNASASAGRDHNNTSTPSSSLSNHLTPVTVSLPPSTTVIASQCTEDYLIVGGGIRLCSASIPYLPISSISSISDSAASSTSDLTFNGSIGKFDLQSNHLLATNGTSTSSVVLYTDFTSGPFTLRFVSNSLGSARGFNLIFRQNPCN